MRFICLLLPLTLFSLELHSVTLGGLAKGDQFSQAGNELINEEVIKISHSQRILILSNNEKKLAKGDFITLVIRENLVSRAIVAKVTNKNIGIKILKIYSLKNWSQMRRELPVKIIRGDDSFFKRTSAKKDFKEDDEEEEAIQTEEDLFNEVGLSVDGLEVENDKKRAIKVDNIIGLSMGVVRTKGADGESQGIVHYGVKWAYQVRDNFWGQVLYGQSLMKDFPGSGQDTKLTTITLRGKYTFKAPLDSFIQPYAGLQIFLPKGPDLGNPTTIQGKALVKSQTQLLEDAKKNSIIFGISILKRLVPGWFASADLGTDVLSLGLSLEF